MTTQKNVLASLLRLALLNFKYKWPALADYTVGYGNYYTI